MALLCFVICGIVSLAVTAIVVRDACREIRSLREWQLQMRHGGVAGRRE